MPEGPRRKLRPFSFVQGLGWGRWRPHQAGGGHERRRRGAGAGDRAHECGTARRRGGRACRGGAARAPTARRQFPARAVPRAAARFPPEPCCRSSRRSWRSTRPTRRPCSIAASPASELERLDPGGGQFPPRHRLRARERGGVEQSRRNPFGARRSRRRGGPLRCRRGARPALRRGLEQPDHVRAVPRRRDARAAARAEPGLGRAPCQDTAAAAAGAAADGTGQAARRLRRARFPARAGRIFHRRPRREPARRHCDGALFRPRRSPTT